MVVVGYDAYWLGADCNLVGYCKRGYKEGAMECEDLWVIGWLEEAELISKRGKCAHGLYFPRLNTFL